MSKSSPERARDGACLVFLHIPKAAGTTMSRILERQFPLGSVRSFYQEPREHIADHINALASLDPVEKAKVRYIQGHITYGIHQYLPQPCSYFTILRDPVDRLISAYYYMRQRPDHPAHDFAMKVSLEEYFQVTHEDHESNWQTGCVSGDLKAAPPQNPLPADALERAKKNLLSAFDMYGVTQRFDETLLLLQDFFGWRNVYYVRRNVTENRPSRDEIPGATLKRLEKYTELDMEFIEYASKVLDERIEAQGTAFQVRLRAFRRYNRFLGFPFAGSFAVRKRIHRALGSN